MISGNALNYLPGNIYAPISTMASFIVSQLDSALLDPTGMAVRSLAEVAIVLCLISIVVNGYFGYVTMVAWLGWKFSVTAGSVALAIIALPYISCTSEMALRQVPRTFREAALALGATEGKVAMRISLQMALPGIPTGILLAFAISVGETAPLLYTAGWSNYLWGGHLTNEPIG